MGQLCCFPFSRAEEKLNLTQRARRVSRTSARKPPEPDEEELVSLSKRLVEDAVLRAVQQYMEETQHSNGATQPKGDRGPPPASPTATQLPADGINSNANSNKQVVAPSPRSGRRDYEKKGTKKREDEKEHLLSKEMKDFFLLLFGAGRDESSVRRVLDSQRESVQRRLGSIRTLLAQPAVRAQILQELCGHQSTNAPL
ncbi:hypothetical protein ACEWY4_022313 [Coilia grayii]|uniref:A-kinase anchor protein 7 RI-RII subunit-binding domain-containing protein n=1 Tax=Coilia grayii TaxID=363190 RepID=A0ABD1J7H0_9TELE